MNATGMPLTRARADRAAGVMLGVGCGDALGAGYEFGPPLPDSTAVVMAGGGAFGWAPGEWTDDTAMAIPLLQAAAAAQADGVDPLDRLDDVVAAWAVWATGARDVGVQTRAVLTAAARSSKPVTAAACRQAAADRYRATGRAGGNGSLMRTAPIALAYLSDEERMAIAARTVSDLTHPDPDAGDACVLWCAAIRHAVLTGQLDATVGLHLLPANRAALWRDRLAEATEEPPEQFSRNGWVVHALQAAWSAIAHTPIPEADTSADSYPAQHLQEALERCVRLGGDTDTVAAIAGGLLGAAWGASAVPAAWRRRVHGWPRWTSDHLLRRGLAVATGQIDRAWWPLAARLDYTDRGARGRLAPHPHDPGVLLGDAAVLDHLPQEIDAIVSLCRVGTAQPPNLDDAQRVTVWLIDSPDPDANSNLDFVLADTADAIAALRAEGHTVLVHCAAAQSRTPTVAAAYAIRHHHVPPNEALVDMVAVLPDARPNAAFLQAVRRIPPELTPGAAGAADLPGRGGT